jgi:hypothetical protein
MKKDLNVTLDFTIIQQDTQQPIALMPAELAKKLLKMYAKGLVNASPRDIILPIIDELQGIINDKEDKSVDRAVQACMQFVAERQLIDDCSKENWNVYSTEPRLM